MILLVIIWERMRIRCYDLSRSVQCTTGCVEVLADIDQNPPTPEEETRTEVIALLYCLSITKTTRSLSIL